MNRNTLSRAATFAAAATLFIVAAPSADAQILYVSNTTGNTINRITPGGVVSTFASGLNGPVYVAFRPLQPSTAPEAGTLGLLAAVLPIGVFGLMVTKRRKN